MDQPRVSLVQTIRHRYLLQHLALLWDKAILEEKHELLNMIFQAVYVDLQANRFVVGIQAKPAFYTLFQSLEQNDDSKVVIFDPNDLKVEGRNVTALSDDQV